MNHPSPTTTQAGQLLEPFRISLLQISQPRAMEASLLKFLLRVLQALPPALSLTQGLPSPAFSPVPGIFPIFLLTDSTTLPSSLTSPDLSSLPNHHPKPLQATFLACRTSPPALKDCPRDLFRQRPEAPEVQLLSLGIQ